MLMLNITAKREKLLETMKYKLVQFYMLYELSSLSMLNIMKEKNCYKIYTTGMNLFISEFSILYLCKIHYLL